MPSKKSSGRLQDLLHGFEEETACVYVVTAEDAGTVKIGYSKNPGERNSTLQVGHDSNLTIYWAARLKCSDARAVERFIHKRLQKTKYHRQGEWYAIKASEAAWFIAAAARKLKVHYVPDVVFGCGPDPLSLTRVAK